MNSFTRKSLSLVLLAVSGVCFWNSLPDRLAQDARQAVVSEAEASVRTPQAVSGTPGLRLNTTPIQDIRVGQRVMAHNPEVSDEERASWKEPRWSDCRLVRLEMVKPDESILEISMIRPREWFETERYGPVSGPAHQSASPTRRAGSHRPNEAPNATDVRPVGTGPTATFNAPHHASLLPTPGGEGGRRPDEGGSTEPPADNATGNPTRERGNTDGTDTEPESPGYGLVSRPAHRSDRRSPDTAAALAETGRRLAPTVDESDGRPSVDSVERSGDRTTTAVNDSEAVAEADEAVSPSLALRAPSPHFRGEGTTWWGRG